MPGQHKVAFRVDSDESNSNNSSGTNPTHAASKATSATGVSVRKAIADVGSLCAQLVEVNDRIRQRHSVIEELLAAQDDDYRLQRKFHTRIDEAVGLATVQYGDDEASWAREVQLAVSKVEARWAQSLSDAEYELEQERRGRQQDADAMHQRYEDAVATIRTLEASLDQQRTAANIVMHATAGTSLLSGAGAGGSRVASIVHHREAHNRSGASTRSGSAAGGGTGDVVAASARPNLSVAGSATDSVEDVTQSFALRTQLIKMQQDLFREREEKHILSSKLEAERLRGAASSVAPRGPGAAPPMPIDSTPPRPNRPTVRPSDASVSSEGAQREQYAAPYAGGGDFSGADAEARFGTPPRPSSLGGRRPTTEAPTLGDDTDAATQHRPPLSAHAGWGEQSTIAGDSTYNTPDRNDARKLPAAVANAHSEAPIAASGGSGARDGGTLTLGLVLGKRREAVRNLLGIEVVNVMPNSPAAAAGLRPRSILLEVNGWKLRTSSDLAAALLALKESELERNRRGEPPRSHVTVPFQALNLPKATQEENLALSGTQTSLDDQGRRLSWEGTFDVDVSHLAVGPFNQRRERYIGSPTDFAPVHELETLETRDY
jgi:hypothetical protein